MVRSTSYVIRCTQYAERKTWYVCTYVCTYVHAYVRTYAVVIMLPLLPFLRPSAGDCCARPSTALPTHSARTAGTAALRERPSGTLRLRRFAGGWRHACRQGRPTLPSEAGGKRQAICLLPRRGGAALLPLPRHRQSEGCKSRAGAGAAGGSGAAALAPPRPSVRCFCGYVDDPCNKACVEVLRDSFNQSKSALSR